MNEKERQAEAVDLVEKSYAGGAKNLENVIDELSQMSPDDRRDVIKKMERIDQECHKDQKMAKELGLPTIHIIDRDTANGHEINVWTTKPKDQAPAPAPAPAEQKKR